MILAHNLNIFTYRTMIRLRSPQTRPARGIERFQNGPNSNYLGDAVAAPAEDVPPGGICTQTSFGFGANAWSAHSASRSARRCDRVRCCFGTVTAIFPWFTILTALRASGVQ